MTNLALAGATGWTGRAIALGALAAPDVNLKTAIARSSAGRDLGAALGVDDLGVPVFATVEEALDGVDVLVEFTSHAAAKAVALAAIERGVAVVIGSSGLTAADFAEIDAAARTAGVGAVASGNFSLTAAMMLAGAELAARHLTHWEIIDYAKSTKPDAPSGTSFELAERLAEVGAPQVDLPVDQVAGHPSARGATIAGSQIHSVRLPSFIVSTEIVFGGEDERLSIRHDAGGTAQPYVNGVLLAVRRARGHVGLIRGLDRLLLNDEGAREDSTL
ncbi:4-hydroxy-tetrahydrodipicolinate reductase [Solirubrobacter sp. CPCC 204708]|uniref:4-hydroxy-tetrahydrodipicolinate reductase n=1 Tax=Solirubrobacter deserti TaxID=2282478 RepID=A0ABT4REV1_9ACTN|nr:4-hydroxy-tetrahydrodipicolinate reductase [Solirubrobacter deserti]MBE2318609.1 4-hydroxy-tetrahydrodipicolinate reductase [Solirubrobacter deserti]MDA0137067.1 4-hydroxy-tetrahydrodipicolinate reductase [Solirubrobacter deserti]